MLIWSPGCITADTGATGQRLICFRFRDKCVSSEHRVTVRKVGLLQKMMIRMMLDGVFVALSVVPL